MFFTTLVAVVAALVLGHIAPAPVASLRRHDWFDGWIRWLLRQAGEGGFLAGRYGVALVLVPPLLLLAALQYGLHGAWIGLPALAFGILALVYAWGPRDLDVDVEAILDAQEPQARREALDRLGPSTVTDGHRLAEVVVRASLQRWFAVLFWFLLLGPVGALLYRLASLLCEGESARLPQPATRGARTLLRLLEWPVAQLMVLSMALVGNFDAVFRAWKAAGGDQWRLETACLDAAARASVAADVPPEDGEDGSGASSLVPLVRDLPELRDAMSLVWRILMLWLALLALMVLAGWVG